MGVRSRLAVSAATAAAVFAMGAGACSSSSAPPTTQAGTTTAPRAGMPGAIDKAEQTKDQTNQRTQDLENQVDQMGR